MAFYLQKIDIVHITQSHLFHFFHFRANLDNFQRCYDDTSYKQNITEPELDLLNWQIVSKVNNYLWTLTYIAFQYIVFAILEKIYLHEM